MVRQSLINVKTAPAEQSMISQGQVALLGDACHPTLPYQAQGAAMAVEDGTVIGTLLGLLQADLSNGQITLSTEVSLKEAQSSLLKLYEELRKPRTTRNVKNALVNRWIFHLEDGLLQTARDFLLRMVGMTRESDWTWWSYLQKQALGFDVLQDCEEAYKKWRKDHIETSLSR
jgi:salicylate hydroxylase